MLVWPEQKLQTPEKIIMPWICLNELGESFLGVTPRLAF